MPQTEDSINKYIIGKCQCNENIWRIGEQVVYVCDEYPCYPQDLEEEGEDENGNIY